MVPFLVSHRLLRLEIVQESMGTIVDLVFLCVWGELVGGRWCFRVGCVAAFFLW